VIAGTEVTPALRITADRAATDFRLTERNGIRRAARQTSEHVTAITTKAFMSQRQRMDKNNFFEPNVAIKGLF
jgi:hypothetical protein